MRYASSRLVALSRYLDDGTLEIDNDSDDLAAAIYALIEIEKLNTINPQA
jgi:hypothetical protein